MAYSFRRNRLLHRENTWPMSRPYITSSWCELKVTSLWSVWSNYMAMSLTIYLQCCIIWPITCISALLNLMANIMPHMSPMLGITTWKMTCPMQYFAEGCNSMGKSCPYNNATSWRGNVFHLTVEVREAVSHLWIPLTKENNAELWMSLCW